MKRWIWIVIAAVVIGAVLVGARVISARRTAQALEDLETVPLERGSLTAMVGATGTVRANQNAHLTYAASGEVGEVLVRVGEIAAEDEVLAILDPSSLSTQLILAETDLVNAQKALEDLLASEIQQAQAQQALFKAQDALDVAVHNWRFFRSADPRSTGYELRSARQQLSVAEDRLEDAQAEYEAIAEGEPGEAAALEALNDAQAAVDLANWLIAWYEGDEPGEIDHALLDAAVALAQANLEEAQRAWERVADGPHPDDIAAAEARVAAAEATLATARVSAPFSGTITTVDAIAGDLVNPGSPAFTLTDLSHLYVDVGISEVDINQVQIGQDAMLVFDAVIDQEYHGEVVAVALTGTAVQGVVNFQVTVELLDADEAVKPGMTAAITIVVNRIEDVLLIPNRAVRVEDGQRVVYVMRDGLPEMVSVQLGASSEMYSELVEGDLQEGDLIVLSVMDSLLDFDPPHRGGAFFGGGR
jgi:HlyD family secretion protein